MFRSLATIAAALLLLCAAPALASTCPAQTEPLFPIAGGNVFGATAPQWEAYFGAKVDAEGGTLCDTTITGTVNFTGAQILGWTISGLILGPTSTTIGFLPVWENTTGTALGTGVALSSLLPAANPAFTGTLSGANEALTGSLTLPSQSGGTFFAAPSGSSGVPAFRPLAQADLPNITPSGGSVASPIPALLGRAVNVVDHGAKCDGVTDDSGAINSTLGAEAGHLVFLPPNATCIIDATITLPSNTWLACPSPGTTIKWNGASGGIMFESSQTAVTNGVGLVNCTINPNGLAGTIVRLDSGYGDTIEKLTIPDAMAAGGIVLDLHADIGSPPTGNLYGLNVRDVMASGKVGSCVTITGSGGATPTDVVTDNNFFNIMCTDTTGTTYNFVQDADTNRFYGAYGQLDANNAVGIGFGSANYSAQEGVYENAFYGVAIDSFSGFTGRTGAIFGVSPNNTLDDFVQAPVAENGAFVYSGGAQPEFIRYINNISNYMRIYEGNSSIVTAAMSAVGSCTGLGSIGVCGLVGGSTASHGAITLAPGGTAIGSSGVAELTLPVAAQNAACTYQLQDESSSSGTWSPSAATPIGQIVDTTHVEVSWSNGGTALTAGPTWYIGYSCHFLSTGWQ